MAANVLIVGLGNPGREYAGTRHNIGAEAVGQFAQRIGALLKAGKERAFSAEVRHGGSLVALALPQTFMNLSGESVRLLVKRHGINDLKRLIVVHDELDLACGVVKVKSGGGLAGHNGLKSIHAHLHSSEFTRIRIGIGRPSSPGLDVADYVLGRPGKAEQTELAIAVATALDTFEELITQTLNGP